MVIRTLIKAAGKINVYKAGETVAKSVAAAAPTAPAAATAAKPFPFGTTHVVTGPPPNAASRLALVAERAVTKEEAPTIQPAAQSTETTMMPWVGWFQRWAKSVVGVDRFESVRRVAEFMPDDIYGLQQNPKPSQKIPISKTDPTITAMYRYPSPGSQPPVVQPEFEETEGEDPYDTGYFKRDTRRRYLSSELKDPAIEKAKLLLMDQHDPAVQEELKQLQAGPASSPGNKGKFPTGPSDFDPTGLRATMSVSWAATEASLDQHMPDHLPTPVWMKDELAVVQHWQAKGLPVPIGGFYAPNKIPTIRRVARW
jgi:hypothetical protein